MRQAKVFFKNEEAGRLIQNDDGTFMFTYLDHWLIDTSKQSISLTLPKTKKEFHSKYLFSFFFNMLPEGTNKEVICQHYRLDKDDYFGLLMTTAIYDTIGAVRVSKIENL